MRQKFDIQLFGGGGSTTRVQKRDPEPEGLTNIRNLLYDKILPGVQSFSAEDWNRAKGIADSALQQQGQLLGQIPGSLDRSNGILDEMMNVVRTGEVPSAVTDRINSSVTRNLQTGMGSMLNSLASRGVVNSSITSQGVSRLGQQAADAYNQNYLNTLSTVLSGYSQGLQGAQNNTGSLLSGVSALGNIPSQAYSGVSAAIMPAYNFWKDWQNSYDNREDYDTVVKQGK